MRELIQLELDLQYHFRQPELLTRALTHSSYGHENTEADNEQLEFLGDAIVGVVMADWLYRALPNHSEGDLTVIRSTLVREETLARWASEIDLGEHLLLGRGEIRGHREFPGHRRPARDGLGQLRKIFAQHGGFVWPAGGQVHRRQVDLVVHHVRV